MNRITKWILCLVFVVLIALTLQLSCTGNGKSTELPAKVITKVYQTDTLKKVDYNESISDAPVILLLSEPYMTCEGKRNRIATGNVRFSSCSYYSGRFTFSSSCHRSFNSSHGCEIEYDKELVITDSVTSIAKSAGIPVSYKEVYGGYIINVSESSKTAPELTVKGLFPPLVLVSPNLQSSCDFWQKLTGTKIIVTAQHPIKVVEHYEQFAVGQNSYQPLWEQNVFHTDASATFPELMSLFAEFHGCAADVKGDSVVIRDQTPDEVRQSVDDCLSSGPGNEHFEYSLQPSAASEIVRKMNSSRSINIRARGLRALLVLNRKVGRDELYRLLDEGFKAAKLDDLTKQLQEDIISNLILFGDDAIIPYIIKSYEFSDALTLLGVLHTQKAAERQKDLLEEKSRQTLPVFKIEGMDISQKPKNASKDDLANLLDLAIKVVNCDLKLQREECATKSILSVSEDCLSAEYHLFSQTPAKEEYHYKIEFSRFQNNWFVKKCQEREEIFEKPHDYY